MNQILPMLVGFSIGVALLLAAALAMGYRQVPLPWPSRVGGLLMLGGLALTQLAHLHLITGIGVDGPSRRYIVVLFLQSLGFYWLLLGALRPEGAWPRREWLLPVFVLVLAFLVPQDWAIPLALVLATVAVAHLGVLVFRLRALRRWFALELKVLAVFALMAVVVAAVGVLAPHGLGWVRYAWIYGALIALGFWLVSWLLLAVPDLLPKAREAVAVAYAQSTLDKIDRESMAARLRQAFEQDQVHCSESLSLSSLAALIGLSSHQLSELVNTQFGMGFSRLVREYRVQSAKRMLVEEPRASVLSVGMACGFNSQSSFYVAFKEQLGETPAAYRKRILNP
ncbi:MAG: helix-turn-helix domain-containing protein [Dokdonella sp.]|jgi:AraC-like DNA-binding protein|uniref:AraC family transcriptional regulator n=1 Tax=Dokdonella sp. TaxID=2291710 RepID=UPI001B5EA697|nr:helix-turn-helix domain-containing protein [Dokdonella sp.]MCC6440119.1 AraC family transcriptional regulator [Rhodanobacteraceae bacterium]MBK8122884.1 AraC family transcriptional regulator [Dokdonella sp.]MBP6327403.1 AraC family transcriptional regulator [Dokdonella sp.]MBP6329730.1 AraC family transcriptional regulator [Dokdonella sp.]HNV08447.1 helix-turn-helix domain-containing protein [Dokdonella sp.]